MLRHRIFRLKSKVSLLGLELTDWVVVLVSWLVLKQGLSGLLGDRLSLLIAATCTFAVFRLWQRIKDVMPDRYAFHLIAWLIEADVYRLSPDFKNAPLIVQPEVLSKTRPTYFAKEVPDDLAPAEG